MNGNYWDRIREIVAETSAAQGKPAAIEDPAVARRIARLLLSDERAGGAP